MLLRVEREFDSRVSALLVLLWRGILLAAVRECSGRAMCPAVYPLAIRSFCAQWRRLQAHVHPSPLIDSTAAIQSYFGRPSGGRTGEPPLP